MPLIKAQIKAGLVAGLQKASQAKAEMGIDEFTDMLSDVIIDAIKSAQITIPPGTIITAGSPATQTQSVPGIVQNGLS